MLPQPPDGHRHRGPGFSAVDILLCGLSLMESMNVSPKAFKSETCCHLHELQAITEANIPGSTIKKVSWLFFIKLRGNVLTLCEVLKILIFLIRMNIKEEIFVLE